MSVLTEPPAIEGLQEARGDFEMAEDYWANGENFVPQASTCKAVRALFGRYAWQTAAQTLEGKDD